MSDEARVTSDELELERLAADDSARNRMSRADALSVLANLAMKRDTTLEEVVAIQVAVRSVAKRMFDRERNFKRRHEREAEADIPCDKRFP